MLEPAYERTGGSEGGKRAARMLTFVENEPGIFIDYQSLIICITSPPFLPVVFFPCSPSPFLPPPPPPLFLCLSLFLLEPTQSRSRV